MRKIIFILFFLSAKAFSISSSDAFLPINCIKGQQLSTHLLDKHYQSGPFTIYYTLEGEDKLSNVTSSSQKFPPLRVLDIAKQLNAANDFYQHDVHLTFPLNQVLYKKITHINVFIIALKLKGSAFDKPAFEIFSDGSTTPCGLRIMISNKLDPTRKQTPAHELFHLYQYGYSIFKQQWYIEGMARFMETTFKDDENTRVEINAPFMCYPWYSQSYKAAIFWQSIAHHYNDIRVTVPQIYYSNKEPVFKKKVFTGGGMVMALLNGLKVKSQEMAIDDNRPIRNWTSVQRRRPQDNDTICRVVNGL